MENSEDIGFFRKFCGFSMEKSESIGFFRKFCDLLVDTYNLLILYVVSLGRGNQCLYKWSRSHDQDGHHAHICGKIL